MLLNKFLQKAATLKFAKSTMCVHTCIACQVCSNILASMQSGYRRALLGNSTCELASKTDFCKNRRVYIHLLCLLFYVSP